MSYTIYDNYRYYSILYSTIVTLNTLIVTYVFRLVYNKLYSPGVGMES
jgi:hypothetical protein